MEHRPTQIVHRRRVLKLAATGLLLPGAAAAYLLPNDHLLQRAARRLSRKGDLQVALVGSARTEAGPVPIGERWIFSGRHVQVDVNGPRGRTARWRRGGRAEGDPSLLPSEAERVVFGRLFGDRDVAGLARDLRVDLDASHLELLGDRAAHVVGVAHRGRRDRAAAAIWVDQATFEVLRVRVPGRVDVELRLTEWAGPSTRGLFPQRLQVTAGGRWLRRLDVDRAHLVEAGRQ